MLFSIKILRYDYSSFDSKPYGHLRVLDTRGPMCVYVEGRTDWDLISTEQVGVTGSMNLL